MHLRIGRWIGFAQRTNRSSFKRCLGAAENPLHPQRIIRLDTREFAAIAHEFDTIGARIERWDALHPPEHRRALGGALSRGMLFQQAIAGHRNYV
jgi:hypothetical protein